MRMSTRPSSTGVIWIVVTCGAVDVDCVGLVRTTLTGSTSACATWAAGVGGAAWVGGWVATVLAGAVAMVSAGVPDGTGLGAMVGGAAGASLASATAWGASTAIDFVEADLVALGCAPGRVATPSVGVAGAAFVTGDGAAVVDAGAVRTGAVTIAAAAAGTSVPAPGLTGVLLLLGVFAGIGAVAVAAIGAERATNPVPTAMAA